MKRLIVGTQKYVDKMNLLDLTLLKFCLGSMGILLGMAVPRRCKKKVAGCTSIIFALTYVPLMAKFFSIVSEETKENC